MASELSIYDRSRGDLELMRPTIEDLLRPTGIPIETFAQTALLQAENITTTFTPESFVAATVSLAVVGLLPDGVTGQSFLIPFAGKLAPVIGYKGFNTLADRVGRTVTGGLWLEGDHFEWDEGSSPFISHKRLIGGGRGRKVKAAFAIAAAQDRTPIISIVEIDELEDLQQRQLKRIPDWKRKTSPWSGEDRIALHAMFEKTAKRRLNRSMAKGSSQQLGRQFGLAARLDEGNEEMGRLTYLRPDGGLVEHGADEPSRGDPVDLERMTEPKVFRILMADGREEVQHSGQAWLARWDKIVTQINSRGGPEPVKTYLRNNRRHIEDAGEVGAKMLDEARKVIGEFEWEQGE